MFLSLRTRPIWTTLRLVGLAAAVAVAAVVAMATGQLPMSVQAGPGGPAVSVDAFPDAGNTATTVGPIDAGRSITCGATFNVDIVIQGVANISGFQANLLYNPAALKVTAVNYNYLLTTTGTVVIDFGDPTPDTDGDFLLFAAMFSTSPFTGASGDGVLARITLQAVGSGSSALDLTSVKMADQTGAAIPPTANGFYIGPVNDASIAAAPPCADTDGDGCPDVKEQQTAPGSQVSGGLRDYLNPYDYFNPTHDGMNRVDDVLKVVQQYFKDDNDANPGQPPYAPNYNPDTDRTAPGPNAWNLGPPNGLNRVDDILAIVKQYFHDCHV